MIIKVFINFIYYINYVTEPGPSRAIPTITWPLWRRPTGLRAAQI